MTAAPVLEAHDLHRRFEDRDVVAGVSFGIAAGEWVSLTGPSGCGKTTLLQMLGLLDRPNAGTVAIGGRDAWAWGAGRRGRARLAQIGFVFQTHNLFEHLTVRDNVALPAWKLTGSRPFASRQADEWLERFGLSHRRGVVAARLSLGESQRVAVVRALINGPAIVLADEPTGSLDSENGALVLAALERVRAHGTAVLVATHDATVAARGRVVGMRDGRLGPSPGGPPDA